MPLQDHDVGISRVGGWSMEGGAPLPIFLGYRAKCPPCGWESDLVKEGKEAQGLALGHQGGKAVHRIRINRKLMPPTEEMFPETKVGARSA